MSADVALRARIDDFLADYAHAIDDGEFQRWPSFFTEDGVYQVITRENFEAGCLQCHRRDRQLEGAPALNAAKDRFDRGCRGCAASPRRRIPGGCWKG